MPLALFNFRDAFSNNTRCARAEPYAPGRNCRLQALIHTPEHLRDARSLARLDVLIAPDIAA
jgi:hypothetical protein